MRILFGLVLTAMLSFSAVAENYEYKVYFGLSKKDGVVSAEQWEAYEADFAKSFAGFTVTAATGYYLGEKEGSRIITLYMDNCREPQLDSLIRRYVTEFDQHSVLVAKSEVKSWKLVTKEADEVMKDTCDAASGN